VLSGLQADAQVNVTQEHNNPSRDGVYLDAGFTLFAAASLVTTTNDGLYTDAIGGKGHATYTYRVCNAGTQTCSNQATVRF